ncbi:unnamed protein product [Ranitomeya imitator]|uniref:Maestro/Maestro-like HEAT-repeats domain-containing protein n=1 Tax=Ranitomeya imitator TaxID=111125 RepID=A0ABN9LIM3_9NEOB|nr:unnamed protein product [Ranitomeya imitator]
MINSLLKDRGAILLSKVPEIILRVQEQHATCALREVLSQPQSSPAVQELYSQLFVVLLLRISSMVGVQPPKNLGPTKERKNSQNQSSRSLDPCSSAAEALHFMLVQGGSEEVALNVAADGGWENMKREDTHHIGVSSLSSAMVRYAGPKLPDIIKRLQAIQSSAYDNQRGHHHRLPRPDLVPATLLGSVRDLVLAAHLGSVQDLVPAALLGSVQDLVAAARLGLVRDLMPAARLGLVRDLVPTALLGSVRDLVPAARLGSVRDLVPAALLGSVRDLVPAVHLGSVRGLVPAALLGSVRDLVPAVHLGSVRGLVPAALLGSVQDLVLAARLGSDLVPAALLGSVRDLVPAARLGSVRDLVPAALLGSVQDLVPAALLGSVRDLVPAARLGSVRDLVPAARLGSVRDLVPAALLGSVRDLVPAACLGSDLVPAALLGSVRDLVPAARLGSVRDLVPAALLGSVRDLVPAALLGSVRDLVPAARLGSVRDLVPAARLGSVQDLVPAALLGSVRDLVPAVRLGSLLLSSDLSDLIFLEPLMENMTGRLKDSNVTVRMLAVRGLGNIASGYPEKVRKHGSHLLTAMINAMDDREDPDHIVTQEAMSNLSRLLPHVQDSDMQSLLIHTAIRIRPFFDHYTGVQQTGDYKSPIPSTENPHYCQQWHHMEEKCHKTKLHLDTVSSYGHHTLKNTLKKQEQVQRRATRMVSGLRSMSYEEWLMICECLAAKRLRGDLVVVYRYLKGCHSVEGSSSSFAHGKMRSNGVKLKGEDTD